MTHIYSLLAIVLAIVVLCLLARLMNRCRVFLLSAEEAYLEDEIGLARQSKLLAWVERDQARLENRVLEAELAAQSAELEALTLHDSDLQAKCAELKEYVKSVEIKMLLLTPGERSAMMDKRINHAQAALSLPPVAGSLN